MKINFSIDYNWLAVFLIKKELERKIENCEDTDEDVDMRSFLMMQLNEIQKKYDKDEEESFKSDLFSFLDKANLEDNKIDLTTLEVFAKSWVDDFLKSKEHEMKKFCRSYVLNKETGNLVQCKFGEHWLVIESMLEEKFGRHITSEQERFEEVDAWIENNIELRGNFFNAKSYKLRAKKL